MSENQRNRGRILTPAGLHKLLQAIRAWEIQQGIRCTQEKIRELSDAFKEGGLDPGTIRKILEAKESVDRKSIQYLFQTFGLQLDEADWMTAAQGKLQIDPNFVGRDEAIADLNTLVSRAVKVIVIQARGGVGKTTLARKYLQQKFDAYLEFPIAKETKDIASIESLIEEKLRQLGEEPGREFFVSLDRLKRKLQAERIGILIDNLEPALDAAGKLIEPHRRYVELLRVLADPSVQAVTLITSRERLNEYSISMQHYLLSELSLAAWTQFFQNRFAFFGGDRPVSAADDAALAALHRAYGGNAKAMDILCGAVLTDYSGKLAAYWQANQDDLLIERALEDLVVGQFDRLRTLNPDAYKLLCRLGCYRYQDVPTVPIEGLFCLLWDVPENRQKRVVKALQDRSLVEFAEGEYWLHPVIRGEAIDRLRGSEDWESTNRWVARFWLENVKAVKTTKDALEAFEAYYHYLEIHDFEGASDVILVSKPNKWLKFLTLGASLYRMGLYQQLISEIPKIINNLDLNPNSLKLSGLYQILGNAHWAIGDVRNALDYQENARMNLEQHPNLNCQDKALFVEIREMEILSLFSTGLYKIDLWEIEDSDAFFSQVTELAKESDLHRRVIKASSFLSFTKAILGFRQEALILVEQAYQGIFSAEYGESGGSSFYLWAIGKAYRILGNFQKANEVYQKALSDVTYSGYTQGKARILSGIAEINREQAEFKVALLQHFEAIELLEKIGAKCDLAEIRYQLGLTYQATNEVEKSNESFQRAIRLFTEMEAPRQVERVRRSMEQNNEE